MLPMPVRLFSLPAAVQEGGTPLHYAAGYGRSEVTEALLAAGADKEAKEDVCSRSRRPFT